MLSSQNRSIGCYAQTEHCPMSHLVKILRNHPWQTSVGIIAIYFFVFAFPALGNSESFGHGEGKSNIGSMIRQLPMEIGLVVSVLVIIGILGLWRESGFRPVRQGGLKFVLPPAIFTILLLCLALIVLGDVFLFMGIDVDTCIHPWLGLFWVLKDIIPL